MREPGYYWVKQRLSSINKDVWMIGAWDGYHWTLNGAKLELSDEIWSEIDERRIVRDEFNPIPTIEHQGRTIPPEWVEKMLFDSINDFVKKIVDTYKGLDHK